MLIYGTRLSDTEGKPLARSCLKSKQRKEMAEAFKLQSGTKGQGYTVSDSWGDQAHTPGHVTYALSADITHGGVCAMGANFSQQICLQVAFICTS